MVGNHGNRKTKRIENPTIAFNKTSNTILYVKTAHLYCLVDICAGLKFTSELRNYSYSIRCPPTPRELNTALEMSKIYTIAYYHFCSKLTVKFVIKKSRKIVTNIILYLVTSFWSCCIFCFKYEFYEVMNNVVLHCYGFLLFPTSCNPLINPPYL